MLLNRSTQYTLRALLFLARQPEGEAVLTREIADRLGLPHHYLAKLLQPLARKGWLLSNRGRAGGVMLGGQARELTFLRIIESSQDFGGERDCLLGLKACDDASACVLHCQWQPIKRELWDYLSSRTLEQMAAEGGSAMLPDLLDMGGEVFD